MMPYNFATQKARFLLHAVAALIVLSGTYFLPLAHAQQTSTDTPSSSSLLSARGVIDAIDHSTLSSGVSSRITKIQYKRGESFEKGDILVEFDCRLEKANLGAALAGYNLARKTLEKNQELLSFAATGKFDVDISKAEVEQHRSELNARQAIVDECTVLAPFTGRVVRLAVAPFESVQPVQPLIEIVGTQAFEITFIVSSDWLSWLSKDHDFVFKLDNIDQHIRGKVARIGAVVDPVSQTIEVIGIIENPNQLIRAGISGVASFTPPVGG